MSEQDIEALGSSYANIVLDGGGVGQILLPDNKKIYLTAAQTVHAQVEDHGNAGRSRIRFTVVIEVQAQGSAAAYREAFKQALLKEVEHQRQEVARWRDLAQRRDEELKQRPIEVGHGG